jgi:hypothetical protein
MVLQTNTAQLAKRRSNAALINTLPGNGSP